MTISFNDISLTSRIPRVAVEFDSSQAAQGPALLDYTALMLAQKVTAGTGVADSLNPITSVDQAITLCGRGSIGHRMAIAWFASNNSTELILAILDDNGAGAAATGTTTVVGTATEDGTIPLYIGGVRVPVAVLNGDDETAVADAITLAVTAAPDLCVTAGNVAGVVTYTFRHKGELGNDYDLRSNYLASDPALADTGLTSVTHAAIGSVITGTTNPVLTGIIAAMGDTWFQVIANPFTDATSLTALEAELLSRFGPDRAIDGVAFASAAGTQGTLTTLGNTRNSKHSGIIAQPGANPLTPPMEFAAECAGIGAFYLAIDPARPLQTLPMVNAIPPADVDLFTDLERDILLHDGIATTKSSPGGIVRLERMVTTYQTNAAAVPDTAYLDANTLFTLLYLRYAFRVRMLTKYPRHKLAGDDVRPGAGQKVMTPLLGRSEALGWFDDMADLNLVEDKAQFKVDLVVERSTVDPNRLDFLLPPNLTNQMRVFAAQIAFRL